MRKTPVIFMTTLWFLGACGNVGVGPAAIPNDPLPTGIMIAQGSFSGLNGQAVSGLASVYRDSTSGICTVRVEGISVPNEPALQIQAQATGETVLKTPLRFKNGTQNYVTSVTDTRKWDAISIVSTQNGRTPLYGKAQLINK